MHGIYFLHCGTFSFTFYFLVKDLNTSSTTAHNTTKLSETEDGFVGFHISPPPLPHPPFSPCPLIPNSVDRWNLICESFAKSEIGRGEKSEIQQPSQQCSVNTWAVRHLGVLVTAVTHHCLMKLETQRNTNLDIAGYLYDIGHVKLTVAVCICKHLLVCIPNNGFLWKYYS